VSRDSALVAARVQRSGTPVHKRRKPVQNTTFYQPLRKGSETISTPPKPRLFDVLPGRTHWPPAPVGWLFGVGLQYRDDRRYHPVSGIKRPRNKRKVRRCVSRMLAFPERTNTASPPQARHYSALSQRPRWKHATARLVPSRDPPHCGSKAVKAGVPRAKKLWKDRSIACVRFANLAALDERNEFIPLSVRQPNRVVVLPDLLRLRR
jgi:hypothetical protein